MDRELASEPLAKSLRHGLWLLHRRHVATVLYDDQLRIVQHGRHLFVVRQRREGILFATHDQHWACEASEHGLAIRPVQRVLPDENVPAEALVHGPNSADEVAIG